MGVSGVTLVFDVTTESIDEVYLWSWKKKNTEDEDGLFFFIVHGAQFSSVTYYK